MSEIRRALLSVSDKTGAGGPGARPGRSRASSSCPPGGPPGARGGRPDRPRGRRRDGVPRDARRPGEDAAPGDSRRHPGPPRPRRRTWRRSPATASARSIWSWWTSIRSRRRSREAGSRLRGRHRADRRGRPGDDPRGCEEPRGRRGRRSTRPSTRRVLEELRRSGGAVSADDARGGSRSRRSGGRPSTTRRSPPGSGLPAARRLPPLADALRFPPVIHLDAERAAALRYGENPHQRAAFYRPLGAALGTVGLGALRQLHGPELWYNNLLDLAGGAGPPPRVRRARRRGRQAHQPLRGGGRARTWPRPSRARARPIPSRSTAGSSASTARWTGGWWRRWPGSCSRSCSRRPSSRTRSRSSGARRRSFASSRSRSAGRPPARRHSRLVACRAGCWCRRRTWPTSIRSPFASRAGASRRPPSWRALRFAWRVAKHVKSNAIVLTSEEQVLGVGAGQMSRVDSARLAVMRAREHGHNAGGAACGLGRVLPVPGRPRRRRGGGRRRRDPSGRLASGTRRSWRRPTSTAWPWS